MAADCGEAVKRPRAADLKTRRALLISFGVISVLGGAFVFFYWMTISLFSALTRLVAFAAIMAGVHFIGYRRYRDNPFERQAFKEGGGE